MTTTRREGVCDIEADSLYPDVIHCIGFEDINTGEVFTWTPENLHEFKDFAHTVDHWYGHNFIGYDAPSIKRLLGVDIPVDKITDTLILSRLLFTGFRRSHSLGAWGEDLGERKIEFNDFSTYTKEMLTYMLQDIKVNVKLLKHLRNELKGFSKYSVRLEHNIQQFLTEQKAHGFYLDIDKVYDIYNEVDNKIKDIEATILEHFPPKLKLIEERYSPKYTKKGEMYANAREKLARFDDVVERKDGTYDLYTLCSFNLGSPKQIVERMQEAGWKPIEFTEAGNPKVSETNLNTLPDTAPSGAKKLVEWLMLNNRRTVLQGWLDAYNPVTRSIHGDVFGIGAVTHRMAHRNPQMANIPAVRSPYGEAMRSCLGVRDKERDRLVGVDISGIQLRILAHYLEDPVYTKAVCFGKSSDGTDVHSMQMRILQEIAPNCTRDDAKTFIYAMLLGASGGKLGSILGVSSDKGYAAKDRLFQRIPAFKRVQKMCALAAKRGYMVGLDGRRTPIKSEHFALSAYLQCGEAIIMKQALVFARERLTHIDWNPCAVVHDEVQARCLATQAEELGKGLVKCIEDAGTFFELRTPVTGDYKIGLTWSDTH